jgi:hypothetical protein
MAQREPKPESQVAEAVEISQPSQPAPRVVEAEKLTEDEVERSTSAEQEISLDGVIKNWPKLREIVGRTDKGLPGLLASGKPLAMEGTKLMLGFDFPILKDRFDGQKGANAAVGKALGQLLDTECQVETVITDQYRSVSSASQIDDDDFAALADELGGIVQRQE